jgi:Ca2+-binding EF-hand superfamily protein
MYSTCSTRMATGTSMPTKSGLCLLLWPIRLAGLFVNCTFRQVMRSLGLNPTNKEIADLIAEVDKNGRNRSGAKHRAREFLGNQRLDFQEFVTFMSKHWHERDQEAELREAFRLFDRDNSGFITINELKQVRQETNVKLGGTFEMSSALFRLCSTWVKNSIKRN